MNLGSKKLVVGAVGVCLMVGALLIAFSYLPESAGVAGNVLEVGPGMSYDYEKIQDAVNASSDGDIIIVFDGTYQENIIINKSVTLQAGSTPVIDAEGGVGITVEANNSLIEDMIVTNCSLGVFVHNESFMVHHVTLFNITIYDIIGDAKRGIFFDNVTNSTIDACTISNIKSDEDAYAIYILKGTYNNITDIEIGEITGVQTTYAISFSNAHNNNMTVSQNIGNISSTGHDAYSIFLDCSHNNSITTLDFGDIVGQDGNAGGVRLLDSSRNVVDVGLFGNITGNYNAHGVIVDPSHNNTITTL
jgi:hypothetical protein